MKTLEEFFSIYPRQYIQIKYGKHLVHIDYAFEGAHDLYNIFEKEKFHLLYVDTDILILSKKQK